MTGKVRIIIPKAKEKEVATFSSGILGDINEEFKQVYRIISGINLVVVLSLIAIIISVIGLFLDQMRYNNAAYKEYSEKIQLIDVTRKINNELLQQNKQNQELILKQQNQILELLNK